MKVAVITLLCLTMAVLAFAGDSSRECAFFASQTDENTVTLRWVVSSLEGIVGFNIGRSSEPDTGYVFINTSPLSPESPGEYEDTGIQGGTQYWYHLYALLATGEIEQLTLEPASIVTTGTPVLEAGWGRIKVQYR